MTTIQEMNDKYFKQDGLDALKTRIKMLARLFNENKFPFVHDMVLGFGKISIDDREECFGRIRELSDITHTQVQLKKINDGEKIGYQIEVGI